jgi:H+/Cl- antiporter ClcA
MISLSCGACLGPEAGLGNVGGALGTFVGHMEVFNIPNDYRKLLTLTAMTAAFASLFPSPILAVMIIYELGPNPPRQPIECITLSGIGAVASFSLAYTIIGGTWLEHISQTTWKLDAAWNFDLTQLGIAFIIGIVSGAIGLCITICIGAGRQFFNRLRSCLSNKFLRCVVPPVVGGVFIGKKLIFRYMCKCFIFTLIL